MKSEVSKNTIYSGSEETEKDLFSYTSIITGFYTSRLGYTQNGVSIGISIKLK